MLLITGITGRLGRSLLPLVSRRKVRAIVRDATESVLLPRSFEITVADIADDTRVDKACEGIDTVIHMASIVDYSAPRSLVYHVNVNGTKTVVDACVANEVRNLIYISSTSVYGKKKRKNRITENARCNPTDYYGTTKLAAEQVVLKKKHDLNVIILRPSMMYGPQFREGYIEVIKKIKERRMKILGSGRNRIPLIHADDVARAIICAIDAMKKRRTRHRPMHGTGSRMQRVRAKKSLRWKDWSGSIYNVSSPNPLTQKELYTEIARVVGVVPPTEHIPLWKARLGVCARYLFNGSSRKKAWEYIEKLSADRVYDVSRIRKELRFKPCIDHKKGIRQVVRHFAHSI